MSDTVLHISDELNDLQCQSHNLFYPILMSDQKSEKVKTK